MSDQAKPTITTTYCPNCLRVFAGITRCSQCDLPVTNLVAIPRTPTPKVYDKTDPTRKAVFAGIEAANAMADAYQIDRAGIDVCARAAIAEYLSVAGHPTEARDVSNVRI